MGILDGGETVGNGDCGTAFSGGFEGSLNNTLGLGVKGRGSLIKEKNWRGVRSVILF